MTNDKTDIRVLLYLLRSDTTSLAWAKERMVEAADKIERLRAINAKLMAALEDLVAACEHATFDNGVRAPDGRNEADHWAGIAMDKARALLARGEHT